MKRLFSVIILLIFSSFIFAQTTAVQQKPLTQAEYVKMLYDLQKNPGGADELIETIRTRGIGFELTDGLRSLTTSKSRSNVELKRTLEESARRRTNPEAAKLPSQKEITEILAKAREANLAAVEEMPDFVVKQQVQRSAAYAGTNNFRNLDRLVVAVSYRAEGKEEYKVLSVNGVLQNNAQNKNSYEETGGTSSTGEFVTVLAKIFKPESETKFDVADTDLIRERRTVVFSYSIERDKAQQVIISAGTFNDSTITGMKGKIWIDRENSRVLRIESEATEIPESFPIRSAKRVIDYDWVTIDKEKYLLPSLSDVRLTLREGKEIYETRNVIRFKEYQKYGSEVKILDGDEEEVKDDVKPNQ
jgi:serine/threonine-protein kinase RIO1